MKLRSKLILSVVVFVVLFAAFFKLSWRYRAQPAGAVFSAALWQHMASPGELSMAHTFLENNCAACHTAGKGVEAQKCIVCHADDKALLQRQPTAFHSNITDCAACHLEHQGQIAGTTKMDHAALARIGLKQLESESPQTQADVTQIKRWLEATGAAPQSVFAHLRPEERLLNCASCHQTKDPHRGFFGMDCAECHTTEQWTIAEFRHPSPASQSCAQCHQAPPSHYMEHFKMIDQQICAQPNAKVNECFLCHQTTSWNDIQGIGFYKHH